MPRSSSSNRSSVSSTGKVHVAPPYAVAPFRSTPPSLPPPVSSPTTGQIFKEGIASGVGSGIGFSLGSRMFGSLFGPSQSTVTPMPSSLTPSDLPYVQSAAKFKDEMQQCMANSIEPKETPLCINLYQKTDPSYTEFQQCMKSSDYQIHLCKDFLPSTDQRLTK